MAEWSRNKVDPSKINGGKEFTPNDNLTVAELNAMVNNSFFGVDFVEALADTPDTSEAGNVGTPSVSFVDNGKFKRLKFANLKGETGEQGNGIDYIEEGISLGDEKGYLIHLDNGETFMFSVKNGRGISSIAKTSTSGLVDTYTITYSDRTTSWFTVTNGAKGEKGDSVAIAQTIGTSTTEVMSQNAVTEQLNSLDNRVTTLESAGGGIEHVTATGSWYAASLGENKNTYATFSSISSNNAGVAQASSGNYLIFNQPGTYLLNIKSRVGFSSKQTAQFMLSIHGVNNTSSIAEYNTILFNDMSNSYHEMTRILNLNAGANIEIRLTNKSANSLNLQFRTCDVNILKL